MWLPIAALLKLNLLSRSHSLSPIVTSLVWPFVLKLSGFRFVPRTCTDVVHAWRLFLFQLGQIIFNTEPAFGTNSRLERAMRLVSQRVTQATQSQSPQSDANNFLTLSMVVLEYIPGWLWNSATKNLVPRYLFDPCFCQNPQKFSGSLPAMWLPIAALLKLNLLSRSHSLSPIVTSLVWPFVLKLSGFRFVPRLTDGSMRVFCSTPEIFRAGFHLVPHSHLHNQLLIFLRIGTTLHPFDDFLRVYTREAVLAESGNLL
ncbi:hypothetical protein CJ030_MR4G021307 [Morella rubra]|uniref:Uncharacterized protein n=1 Tax=Morella rubra TaxID=262757 RepID=A0A6A1VVN0_9ROSI|nr:hypothetical protein CJ030_MR4G021307 [Morella rubra]